MKVTFICKGLSDTFYLGNGTSIQGINNMTEIERLEKLFKCSSLPEYQVTNKIGNGTFRDKVELNAIKRKGWAVKEYKKENRKGYILITFEVV